MAAIGDSLTSATAANSAALWEVLIENRGLSWCIGGLLKFKVMYHRDKINCDFLQLFFQGQGSFRTHLTLPNILKEFNPKLFGYVNKNAQCR